MRVCLCARAWLTDAGYHESPAHCPEGTRGTTGCKPIAWYAGIQYDGDTLRAREVLGNFTTFYPGAACYEIAGFFWWQGDRDSRDMGLSSHYEENLVSLIKALRVQYGAPKAKFVAASLGQTVQGATDGGGALAALSGPQLHKGVAHVGYSPRATLSFV